MEHAMSVRAASLAAAMGLMSAAAIAALTATFTNFTLPLPAAPPTIDVMIDRPLDTPKVEPTPPRVLPPMPDAEPTETLQPSEAPPRAEQIGAVSEFVGPVGSPVIANPRWVRTPRELARYYPRRAMERGVEGQVVLDCLVTTIGSLNCDVVSETPRNWGFGEAALRISRDYQMVPAMRDGVPVEGRYRMVAPFRLE